MSSTPSSRKRFSLHTLTRRFKSTSSLKNEKQTPKLGLIAEAHKTTSKLTVIEATITQETVESKDSHEDEELVFATPEVAESPEESLAAEQANTVVIDLTQPTPSFALVASKVLAESVPSIVVEEEGTTTVPAQNSEPDLPVVSSPSETQESGTVETLVNHDGSSQRTSEGSATPTIVEEPREVDATCADPGSGKNISQAPNTTGVPEGAVEVPSPTAVKFLLCVDERATALQSAKCTRCSSCISCTDTVVCNECETKTHLVPLESGRLERSYSECNASARCPHCQVASPRNPEGPTNVAAKNSSVDGKVEEVDRKIVLLSEKVSRVEETLIKLEASLEQVLARLQSV